MLSTSRKNPPTNGRGHPWAYGPIAVGGMDPLGNGFREAINTLPCQPLEPVVLCAVVGFKLCSLAAVRFSQPIACRPEILASLLDRTQSTNDMFSPVSCCSRRLDAPAWIPAREQHPHPAP